MSNPTIDKLISTIFKTLKDSIYDISIVGETLTKVNALKLDATNISGYATALKGLSTQQAQLVMTTNGLTTAQQQAVLSQISLANATGTLTTSQMTSALITETRNEADAKALLLNAGLISSETAEATATNTVTAAKLRELVATGQLTQAEAQLLATKAGVTLANQKEASSFALLGTKTKNLGNSLLALGKAHPFLGIIAVAIGTITTAITIAEKKNEEFIESQEKLIEKIDENISKYDDEISSLDSLQEKLQNAKGDKEALASIQSELNQAIGDTPGLLNEESNAYDIANQKIDDRIERLKELRKLELEDKVTAQKEIFNNTLVDNAMGIDHKFDYFANHKIVASDTLGSEFSGYLEGINANKFETLQSIFEALKKNGYGNGEKSNAEIWKELIDSYGGAMLDVKEIQNYFDSQTEYAQKILSDYINNSESIFSKEELNSIIEDLVESGYSQDLEGIENVITSLVENDELEKTINDYYESLYNDDIDSDALYQNIKGQFDTLVANYPELKGILENYFNSIGKDIKTGINNASQNPDETTVSSHTPFLDKLYTEDYEDTFKELQKLAEAGELTPKTLSSTHEYNQLLKTTSTSAKEACEQLYNMIDANTRLSAFSSNMGNVDKAYAEFKTSGYNTIDTLSSMQGAFGDLSYYEKFVQIAGNAKSSTEEIQQAYEKLVSEYVYSTGILDVVNEENKDMIQTQLEQLGITNAEEIVTKALNNEIMSLAEAKAILTQYGYDLNTVTSKEIEKLIHEGKVSNSTAEQIAILALKKKLANATTITTAGDIKNMVALAGVSSRVITMLTTYASIKKRIESRTGEASTAGGLAQLKQSAKELKQDINKYLNKKQKTNIEYEGGTTTTDALEKLNNTKNEKKTTKTKKQIDWITISLNNLSRTLEKLQTKLENTSSWDKQLKIQDKIIKKQKILTNAYKKSANAYEKTYLKALNKLGKNKNEYKTKIESGEEFSVETFKKEKVYNKVAKAQEAYENWQNALSDYQEENYNLSQAKLDKIQIKADKKAEEIGYLEAKLENANGYKEQNRIIDKLIDKQKEYYELQIKLAKTEKERKKLQEEYASLVSGYLDTEFQNIQAEYDRKTDGQQTVQQRIQDKINLATAQGKIIGNAYYKGLMSSAQAEINYYQDLKNKMIEFRNEAVKLGEVEVGSEEWYNMSKSIAECDSQMDNLKASTEEWNTAMQEIDTSVFDDLIAKFHELNDEADFYIKLLESSGDMFDENGNMTDLGNAKLGMLYTKHQVSQNEGEVAGKEVEYYSSFLDEAEKNGKVVINGVEWTLKELEEKISSLKKTQQDAILSTIDYMEEIYSFIEEGINAEIEAYEELIEKKKEALEADEELYEFQKKLTESSQDIALIERQLAALEGDDSDEARKKRRELEAQKAEAEESHQELIKEQAITMQSENLDNLLKQFEADKKTYLESVKTDLTVISEKVNTNLPAISGTLNDILTKVDYAANKDITFIIDTKNGTVAQNTDNVTNGYVDESKEEKENANNEAQKVVTEVQQQTQDVVAENIPIPTVLFEENDSIRTQIDDIIKSGTKTKKSEADDKKANGEYKYRDVNRYLIKKYGYRINQKKQTEIARLLGMTGATEDNITNIKKQIKLLEKLKLTGFSSGGLVKVDDLNSIVRANGDDGIATVKKDEYVLTPVQSQSFLDFAKISPDLLKASNTLIDGLKLNPVLPTNIIGNAQPQNID